MLQRFTDIQKERVAVGVLVGIGLMRLLNLGFFDLQAWDEALYAVRAEGILRFGGWIDQTPFAIDGLYSSLHPPLSIWLTAVSFALFGVTEFAARLFSAVFGGLTLLIVYRLGKRVADTEVGFVAALLFGLNPFVSFFARQGQFDTTLTFFLSLAMLLLMEHQQMNQGRQVLYAGLAIGAALLTKLFVGLGIPLAYVLWMVTQRAEPTRRLWKAVGIFTAVALLLAGPWYAYMTFTQGQGDPLFFLKASALVDRSLTGIEGNVKPLEVLYYVNQLFVLFPFGVAWFGHGLYRVVREKQPGWNLLGAWLLVFFLVFSLMRTKLAVYMLPMLVPCSLIAAKEIVKVTRGAYTRGSASIFIALTLLSVLWSSSQVWRNATKSILSRLVHLQFPSGLDSGTVLPLLVLAGAVLALSYLSGKRSWIDTLRPAIPYLLLVPSFIICYYQIIGYDRYQHKDGANELADLIFDRQPSEIVVAGYERNPQLTFYLEGADIGWRDDMPVRRIVPPNDRSQFRAWLTDEISGISPDVLVVIEKDKFVRYEWVTSDEVIPPDFALVFESRRYAVFQRKTALEYAHLRPRAIP